MFEKHQFKVYTFSDAPYIVWRRGMAEITKLSITRSFFELETPDLALKFVWTIRTKYKTYKKFLKSTKVKSTHNSAGYRLQILHGSSYRPNYKVQKYKKF